jgi:hypothetical protein
VLWLLTASFRYSEKNLNAACRAVFGENNSASLEIILKSEAMLGIRLDFLLLKMESHEQLHGDLGNQSFLDRAPMETESRFGGI